jgi:hypothetical protein
MSENFKGGKIMKKACSVIVLTLFLAMGLLFVAQAQEAVNPKGELTIPWDEFKKLLNLDADDIVLPMETFQKLVLQTGVKTVPAYSMKEGNVILKRVEFQKLVDQMKPPVGPDIQVPFDYLITKAMYSGKMGRQNTAFTGTLTVHVLKKDTYLKIPVLPQNIALEDIRVNGKPALVVSENGYHQVVLSQPGEYTVTVGFSMISSLEKGPHKLDLNIQQTPITVLNMELPLKDIDVEIPQAQQISTRTADNRTLVSAVITPGRYLSIQWRKKLAVTEKIPAKLYSEVYHLISIEDDVLKVNADINYNILHSEVDGVQLAVPDNMNVLSVSGDGVGEWQEVTRDEQRYIMIPFTYGKKGSVWINVQAEVPLTESGKATAFTGFQVLETVRETGYVGIALNTSAEVIVTENEGMEKAAPQKLPAQLINKSAKPLIMGFKYLKHPFSLVLDVNKHEKIAVPVATINSANIVTLFTEDGKVVHRMIYQVRNSAKQFLEIRLPEGADVWSVFVDNQPVESSLNQQHNLLIPLIRSRSVNNQLETFPVEVILALAEERFASAGKKSSLLPAVDLLVSQIIWSVYLPNDYGFNYFTSTLEKEEMIRGVNLFSNVQRRYDQNVMKKLAVGRQQELPMAASDELDEAYQGKDARSRFKNIPMEEKELSSQMAAEMSFSGRLEGVANQAVAGGGGMGTGVLPIMIRIPTSGQVYRFARTIVKPEDPLTFSVVYTQLWLTSLLKWFIFIVLVLIVYFLIRRQTGLWKWIKKQFGNLREFYRKHETTIRKMARSRMTPFVLLGLIFIFWTVSGLFTLILLFLFWLSVVYQILNFRRKKKEIVVVEPEMIVDETAKIKRKPGKKNPPADK